jgi:hypothetical protein
MWLGPGGMGDEVYVAFTEGAEGKVNVLADNFPALDSSIRSRFIVLSWNSSSFKVR